MKRWLIVGLPLALLAALLLIRPPAFSSYRVPLPDSGSITTPNSSSGVKPGTPEDGYDSTGKVYEKKPAYQGHEADKY